MTQGIFVTFEGGEGAGKSTLIDRLYSKLQEEGYDVIVTREPGGTLLGDEIRSLVLSRDIEVPIGDVAELLLFLSARAQHIQELITPALHSGKIVLCDRFNDSSIAYQGGGRKIGVQKTSTLCDLVCGPVSPDVTFFLDIDVETGLERAAETHKTTASKGEVDKIEGAKGGFHERVRDAFIEIASKNPDRVHCIDGAKSKEDVFSDAWKIIQTKLDNQS